MAPMDPALTMQIRVNMALIAYSITWSARSKSEAGMVRPNALAVLRLTARSNVLACSIGK